MKEGQKVEGDRLKEKGKRRTAHRSVGFIELVVFVELIAVIEKNKDLVRSSSCLHTLLPSQLLNFPSS
jgi:hypothetical protein